MRAPGSVHALPGRGMFDLRRAVLTDLPLKVAAVAVAMMLWAAVAQATPREVTVAFAGRVAVAGPEVPPGLVLRGQLGEVSVRLSGPSDAVGRIGQDQLHATLEIGGLSPRAEPQEAPVRVTVSDGGVKVVEVAPATVSVRLERLVTRAFPVQARLANDPPKGFLAGEAAIAPREVMLSGAESLLGQVTAVYATVRFGDIGVDIVQSAQATAVDAAGMTVESVEAQPAAVQVSVPLVATSSTRTVPIVWNVRGTVAAGYWVSRVASEPAAVTVRGDPAVLVGVDRVEVSVDVSGLTATRASRVPIALPPGVTLAQPTEASITVTVIALTGARPFPLVPVQVTGLPATLVAEADPRTVDVTVGGPLALLTALAVDQVVATVDAAGRAPGTYQLDVAVRVLSGMTVQTVQPGRVAVTIRSK